MHACLNVDEILRLIACELVTSKGRAAAVALACCCKSFEDPVLDALWETQDRLIPLLNSLPGDVWNEGQHVVSAPTTFVFCSLNHFIQKSFKRLPTTLEWARFQKYARRMRSLVEHGALGVSSSEVLSVLQFRALSEPLLPNLKVLESWSTTGEVISFIPLFLSPRTTVVDIGFSGPDLPKAVIASMVTAFPLLCPNLEQIILRSIPRDPMITAGISAMLLATNRNTLRCFDVHSPLTEEGREVIFKLPDLCELSVVIERDTSLPSAVLPNLTNLMITYDHGCDWLRMFQGATLGKLESVTFNPRSEQIGDFLGAFERVALTASIQNTLSVFSLYTSCSWNPRYASLLPFTHLKELVVEFSCVGGCSSSMDDDTIINLARAIPGLEHLRLGDAPCRRIPTGITAKGLVVLAHHCPNLSFLCIHFQVASLSAPLVTAGTTSSAESTAPRRDCALTELEVGEIPVPEQSVSVVALNLTRIFPHIEIIYYIGENWEKVMDAISLSREIFDSSCKQSPSLHLGVASMTPYQEPHSRTALNRETVRGDGALTLHRPFHVTLAQRNFYLLRLTRAASMYDTECCRSYM